MPTTPTPDQTAPALALDLTAGAKWTLDHQSPETFTQIIVYRGLHCPVCESYLGTSRRLYEQFLEKGVETIHVSMDTHERASEAHADWGLDPVPMGYGLTKAQAEDWGLYVSEPIQDSEKAPFAEPGVFWVRPDGRLYLAAVSNSPFARPDLEALLGKVDFIKDKDYPARGRMAA